MTHITAESINSAYLQLTTQFQKLLMDDNPRHGSNHGDLSEFRRVIIDIHNPRKCVLSLPYRNASRRYMAGEVACYLQETRSEEFAYYGKLWADLDVDGEVQSNYGRKIFDTYYNKVGISRFDYAKEQLLKNPDTKNAIIMMKDHRDLRPGYDKDRCCTISLLFGIRRNQLHLEVQMRSSDFWMGLPYDTFWFSFVLQRMLERIRHRYPTLELGRLMIQAASLHVYSKHYQKIQEAELPNYYDIEKDYQIPVWDEQCESRLQDWLMWEKDRRRKDKKGLLTNREDGKLMEDYEGYNGSIMNLRALKLPPFLETLGSYLCNNITQRYATPEDIKMFALASEIAQNSVCIDRKVGCIIRGESGNIYQGFNSVILCNKQCDDKYERVCDTVHAEINALARVADADDKAVKAWVSLYPCRPCMIAFMEEGVQEIIVCGFSHKGAGGMVTLLDPAFIGVNNEL